MQRIKYDEEMVGMTGQPILIADPDVRKQLKAREEAVLARRERYEPPVTEADFASLVVWFVNGLPWSTDAQGKPERKLSIEDAGQGYAAVKAFRQPQDGYVELEDAVYKWLMAQVEVDGVAALRMNAAVLKERLSDVISPERSKS